MSAEAADLGHATNRRRYELLHAGLEASLISRPGEDMVAMCLRKPEAEATDALRGSLNRLGAGDEYLARRKASVGVAGTDLTLQDLPSGQLLVALEAKAITATDAHAPGFDAWFDPQVGADVSKLERSQANLRLFLVYKNHWRWMAKSEMRAMDSCDI